MFVIDRPLTSDDYFHKEDYLSTFWREVFFESHTRGVSDIHIEPQEEGLMVKGRKNGLLTKIRDLKCNAFDQKLYLDRLKLMAKFDTHTMGVRQDRQMELKATNSRYRLCLLPCQYGDKIVLRVIEKTKIPSLVDLNLDEQTHKDLLWATNQKQGFICVTGPTGSGKSTTLQSMILELERETKNIVAIEDPVERHLSHVGHIQITEKLTWKEAIKGVMRFDPDIIIIGEIRDEESAVLAFEAAQTGHLVLTTLHTNDVAGTVDRLIGLKVSRHLIAENLLYLSAQRLVPKLCSFCKIKEGDFFTRGKGCKKCQDPNGISGRVPVIEYSLKPDPLSIVHFNRSEFPLKRDLLGEYQKLYQKGIIDKRELIGRGFYE